MNLCAVMTKTEQHRTSSRGGYCVEENLYIWFPKPGEPFMLHAGQPHTSKFLTL
jgi:hypothetical protein